MQSVVGNPKGRYFLGELWVDGRIILKIDLKETGCVDVDLIWRRIGTSVELL
jgi:hypothetical protein